MKKRSVCTYCGWFFGAAAIVALCFVAIFGAKEMLRSTEPESAKYQAIIDSVLKAAESEAVQAKIKDLVKEIIKEANLLDAQKALLVQIIKAKKIQLEDPCVFGMIDVCEKRDVSQMSKTLGIDPAVIEKFDKEEQMLGEKLARGDIDEASFKLMIEKMEQDPQYGPIAELRASLKASAKLDEQYKKDEKAQHFNKKLTPKIFEYILESLQ